MEVLEDDFPFQLGMFLRFLSPFIFWGVSYPAPPAKRSAHNQQTRTGHLQRGVPVPRPPLWPKGVPPCHWICEKTTKKTPTKLVPMSNIKGQGRMYPVHIRVLPWYENCVQPWDSWGLLPTSYRAYIGISHRGTLVGVHPTIPMSNINQMFHNI